MDSLMKHKLYTLIEDIAKKLKSEYRDPILMHQTAWWLLEAITKLRQDQLIAEQTVELSDDQEKQLDAWIVQLTALHKPLQYILGTVPFNNLELKVRPPILIPRPETEELVIKLINLLAPIKDQQLSILDIGTGTGCIALALAKALPNATVTAVDINPDALDLACSNAHHNHIHNISFIESDVYSNIHSNDLYDLIVSNPPYVSQKEWKKLDPSVTQWEDPHALLAMHEGLAVIEKIIAGAPQHLYPDSELHMRHLPRLVIEIDYEQGPAVQNLMKQAGFHHIEIQKDLEGKDRVAIGRF